MTPCHFCFSLTNAKCLFHQASIKAPIVYYFRQKTRRELSKSSLPPQKNPTGAAPILDGGNFGNFAHKCKNLAFPRIFLLQTTPCECN
jgi:hypothetical protein